MSWPLERLLVLALLFVACDSLNAQKPPFIGTQSEDRARIALLDGDTAAGRTLIRSASGSISGRSADARTWRLIEPRGEFSWNSVLPFSMNDGVLWSGRGLSGDLSAGAAVGLGRIHALVVPQLWFAENRTFPVLPGASPRSGFSSPWNSGYISADLPVRFGNQSIIAVDPGETSVWLTERQVDMGISTESQWWGPGLRNALVMSNNAGGFPHAFVRTSRPWITRAGIVEAKWILGGLSESRFFDTDSDNDLRSLSGLVATLSPGFQKDLTLGITRVVYDGVDGAGAVPARAFDAMLRWGGDLNPRNVSGNSAEQLASAFARWVFPTSGAEVYGEWSRMLLPVSLRALLLAPQFTQGFTIGLQWLPRVTARSKLRVQVEMTNLEQSPTSRSADTLSFYTSSVVPQGYTQRGQVIGAAIGPGSSSQWFAMDVLRRTHSMGAFIGRIRWNTDAYYTTPQSFAYFSYDATIFAGMRGSTRIWNTDLDGELSFQRRYNFLFQNELYGYSRGDAFDKNNVTMKLRVN